MFTKKDIRDWMIDNNVYNVDCVQRVNQRLRDKGDATLRRISCNFDKGESKFDDYFREIGHTIYNDLPDSEPTINYLDILDKL